MVIAMLPAAAFAEGPNQASVNGTDYATLQEAVNKANGAEITLLTNITLASPVEIPAGDTVTINGNENTVTLGYAGGAFSYTTSPEGLQAGTTLTVNGVNFVGHTKGQADYAVIVGSTGGVNVTLSGCSFTNMYDAVYCNQVTDPNAAMSTINIDQCNFSNVAYYYSVDDGYTTGGRTDKHEFNLTNNTGDVLTAETFAVATVNGVGYTDLSDAVANGNGMEINLLDDITLTSAVEIPAGGANITVNGNGHTVTLGYAGAAFNNSASVEGLKEGTSLTVNGVDFVGHTEGQADHAVVVGSQGGVAVTLSGCSFTNMYDAVYCNQVTDSEADESIITIEYCDFDNVAYYYGVDDGYTAGGRTDKHTFMLTENTGDELTAETFAVATVDGVGYTDLSKAVAAAGENGTVKLLKDVALDSMLPLNTKGLILDLNGNEISASDSFAKDASSNNNHLMDITADGVQLKNGTLTAGANNNHTLNVWNAQNVVLTDLKLDNSATYGGAPLIVGASDVTVNGTLTTVTGAKSWYAVNVDSRVVSNANVPASLTFGEGAVADFQGSNPVGIYVEDSAKVGKDNMIVSFGKNVTFTSEIPDFRALVLAMDVEATVENPENAGLEADENGSLVIHQHSFSWDSNSDGHWQVCGCGETTAPEAHTYGDWIVDKIATATEAGSKHHVCTVCGYEESVEIPATGETGGNTGNTGDNGNGGNTGDNGNTGNNTNNTTNNGPKTGDNSNITFAVIAMLVACCGVVAILVYNGKIKAAYHGKHVSDK